MLETVVALMPHFNSSNLRPRLKFFLVKLVLPDGVNIVAEMALASRLF